MDRVREGLEQETSDEELDIATDDDVYNYFEPELAGGDSLSNNVAVGRGKGKRDEDYIIHSNQRYMAQFMYERVIEVNGNEWLKKFKRFDFYVFTPNKNILGKQTLARLCNTRGVLPKYFADKYALNDKDDEAMKFANARLIKLNNSPKENEKFAKIEKRIKERPDQLTLFIFDEAHHSATDKTGKNKNPSPYKKFVNKWHNEYHENVLCFFISATPFNLLTANRRFIMQDTYFDPKMNRFVDVGNKYIKAQKFPKFEFRWTLSHRKDYEDGKEMKLMAPFHRGWLSVNDQSEVYATDNEEEAAIFKIKGDIFDRVRIYHGDLCWTWKAKSSVKLLPEDGSPQQLFDARLNSGEGLIKLFGHGKKQAFEIKFDDNGRDRVLKASRQRVDDEVIHIEGCVAAPPNQTFIMYPKNDKTSFYLSLNHMYNSMRFKDEEKHLIRYDELFTELIKRIEGGKGLKTEIQISLYSLCLIIHQSLSRAGTSIQNCPSDKSKRRKFALTFVKSVREMNKKFCELLETTPNVVPQNTYQNVITEIIKCFHEWYSHEPHTLKLLSSALGYEPISNPMLEDPNEVINTVHSMFEGTMEIITDCLRPYSDVEGSGRMAIVRVNWVKEGKMFKQTLLLARVASDVPQLEIIQDFGEKTSLDKHFTQAQEDAKKFNKKELLRICQRIQNIDECEGKDGGSYCNCEVYVRDTTDPFSIECSNCSHEHTQLDTYSKLDQLPCLLILVDKGRMGDTFPKSLVALDDRNTCEIKSKTYQLTSFTQEKGRLCRHTFNSDLPYMYLGKDLYDRLRQKLQFDCSYVYGFVKKHDGKMKIDNKMKVDGDGNLKVTSLHADFAIDGSLKRINHFLLSAEAQCGKSGGYYNLIARFRFAIGDEHLVVDEPDTDTSDEESEVVDQPDDKFSCTVPHWKKLKELPGVPKKVDNDNKYQRLLGPYTWPVEEAPNIPFSVKLKKKKRKKKTSQKITSAKICTYSIDHFEAHGNCGDERCSPQIQTSDCINLEVGDLHIKCSFPVDYEDIIKNGAPSESIVIMTPSYRRSMSARLNWNHLIDGKFYHFVFVREDEFEEYKKDWGQLVSIVQLPESLPDVQDVDVHNGGVGFVRRFIQLFAKSRNFCKFFMADDNHHSISYGLRNEQNIKFNELHNSLKCLGSSDAVPETTANFAPYPNGEHQNDRELQAFTGPLRNFGVIGFRRWRSKSRKKNRKVFVKKHVYSFFYLNNDAVMEQNVLFKPWWAREDLEFCNNADHKGLHVVKMNAFTFMKVRVSTFNKLYIWTQSDLESLKKANIATLASDESTTKLENLVTGHLKTYRVEKEVGRSADVLKFSTISFKEVKNGHHVLWIKDTNEITDGTINSGIKDWVIVLNMTTLNQLVQTDRITIHNLTISHQGMNLKFKLKQVVSAYNPKPPKMEDIVVLEAELDTCPNCASKDASLLQRLVARIESLETQLAIINAKIENHKAQHALTDARVNANEAKLATLQPETSQNLISQNRKRPRDDSSNDSESDNEIVPNYSIELLDDIKVRIRKQQ